MKQLARRNDFQTSSGRLCDIVIYVPETNDMSGQTNIGIRADWACKPEQATDADYREVESEVEKFLKCVLPEVQVEHVGHVNTSTEREAVAMLKGHLEPGRVQ